MKAGMDFKPNEDLKQTPPKPKGRRGMPVIDPSKGFVVSAHAARALIAKGAADARPLSQTEVLDMHMNKPAAVDAPPMGVITGHQAALHPNAEAQATSVPTVCAFLLRQREILIFPSFKARRTRSVPRTAQSVDLAATRQTIRKIPTTAREPRASQLRPIP